jgi:hypothetical protein
MKLSADNYSWRGLTPQNEDKAENLKKVVSCEKMAPELPTGCPLPPLGPVFPGPNRESCLKLTISSLQLSNHVEIE